MSKFTWCPVSTALAASLHAVNMEEDHKTANSKEALETIGEAVAKELKHKGAVITAQSVRSKLSAEKVYTAYTAPAESGSEKKAVQTKAQLAEAIKHIFGLDTPIATLANANRPILEGLIVAAKKMPRLVNASPQDQVIAAEKLEDAESDMINAGASLEDIQDVEADAFVEEVEKMQSEL